MRLRPIMTNFRYYRSANKTIQIPRSPKHIPGYLPGIYLVQPYQEESWSGLRPSRHQSKSRSILSSLYMCNLRLNVSTQPASTIVCSSWFQLMITRSEKKWRRTSLFVQCLDNFSECPLVLSWFVNWNSDSNGGRDSPLYILKRNTRSALLRLSYNVLSRRIFSPLSYLKSLNPGIISRKRRWIFSINCLSFM